MLNSDIVVKAYDLIKKYIYNTPVIYCPKLSAMIGNKVFVKLDSMQVTGAFKIRGVLNFLLNRQNNGAIPEKIVAYSTGNHAIAMSYAGKLLGIHARVYLPKYSSKTKQMMASSFGAEIIEVSTRKDAEELTLKDANSDFTLLPPSDNDQVIAGAGTVCYEALLSLSKKHIKADAIFAPCGGGGLLAGSYLAKEQLSPQTQLFGVEPKNANDAYLSVANQSIFRFNQTPNTVADGLRALSVSKRTFNYLQKLDGICLVEEDDIIYWNQQANANLPAHAEISASISLAAAKKWSEHNKNKTILILVTGGNS